MNRADDRDRGGRMNSTLKLLFLIGLVGLIVFGVTVISTYSPDPGTTEGGGLEQTAPAQLLRLDRLDARYDPASEDPAARFQTGIYEVGEEERPSSFWFQNVNPTPVRLSILGRSCTSCTSARVALVPPQEIAGLVSRKGVGLPPVGLSVGPLPVPDLGAVLASAGFLKSVRWTEFSFETGKDESVEIPAGTEDAPAWGVFQFGVKMKAAGPVTRSVAIGLQTPTASQKLALNAVLVGAPAFGVTPTDLPLGELPEDGQPRSSELIYWSATRSPAELPPPSVAAPPNDPLVAVGTPTPLSPPELTALQQKFRNSKDAPPVVTAAYRIPLTILPAGAAARDVGPFEKTLAVSGPNPDATRVTLKGSVVGLVGIKDNANLKFGQFDGTSDSSREVTLVSSKTDLELEPVPGEVKPVWLKMTLSPPSTNGPRREWTMKVTIPANSGYGDLPGDAAVVLATREATPRRIRIPVSGTAFR